MGGVKERNDVSSSISLPNPASRILEPPPEGNVPGGGFGVGNLVISVASAADTIVPWGTSPKERDNQLRAFWPTEPIFSGGLFTTVSQYASFSWSLLGPHRTVRLAQEMLSSAQMGQGWEMLMEPFLIDYFTQDNGAFLEIVRTDDSPTAPVISLNHLDSNRCERTGRYQTPVIYTDREGARHTLKWYNVVAMSEFPSPIEAAYGVGYCALTRVLRAAQVMRDIGIVKQEKAGGRFTRQVHLVGGVQTRIIEDAMAQKQAAADSQGYSLHSTSDRGEPRSDFSGLVRDNRPCIDPGRVTRGKSLQTYITIMAMAFGGDYQS